MLNEIVRAAVMAVCLTEEMVGSVSTRRRGIRTERHLVSLIEKGDDVSAQEHWRAHMEIVSRVMLGQEASTVVDLLHHEV